MDKPPSGPLYFEDLTPGRIFRSRTVVIDAAMIKAFAAQYDPQSFHLDEAAASGHKLFRGLAASGWHTAALAMRLQVESLPLAGGVIGAGLDELRWPRPVRPDDRLTLEAVVEETRVSRSKPEQGWVKIRSTVHQQDNEAVLVMVANLVVPRRPIDKDNP